MAGRLAMILALALVCAACSDEEPIDSIPSPQTVATAETENTATTIAPRVTAPAATSTPASSSTSTTVTTTTMPLSELELQLTEVARGFEQPVLVLSPPDDDRLYVVDQPGRIWVIAGDAPQLFVDLNEEVIFGGERGLLGMAFHPDFATNRRFFVNFTGDGGRTHIVELLASNDGMTADPGSQQILLEIEQPASNHNGGMIAFGPEGNLWIGMGDGGGANDEFRQGQRTDTLLGALLRIDVSVPGEYTIPEDNPFVDGGGAPEVWSFGLRNPWRFTFDAGNVLIADVGQNSIEEINVLAVAESRGANFGWPIFEGTECFRGPCDTGGLVDPVLEYSHGEGCSITGGFVYRGSAMPELSGHYFYADFCSGFIRSLGPDAESFSWFGDGDRAITSFGQDAAGEVYVVVRSGSIFRLERA